MQIVVAEDHPLYREALVAAVRADSRCRFVGAATDGVSALELIRTEIPDVAVVDLHLPRLDGIAVLNALEHDKLRTHVLVITADTEGDRVLEAVSCGARGYLTKDESGESICDAIVALGHGETILAQAGLGPLFEQIRRGRAASRLRLSPREREILRMTAAGHGAKEIAAELHLSATTVRSHLASVYEKLGVRDRASAVATAMRAGLLE